MLNMTYASINEAWGGVSGSNQLSMSLTNSRHPVHQQQMRKQEPMRQHTSRDLYQCKYGSHDCEQIFKANEKYNREKMQIASGTQPFTPMSPPPQNYTFSPQYPWYPQAQQGYMMYGPQVSQMWYSQPFQYNPQVANEILSRQMQGGVGPIAPVGPYYPQGFMPLDPRQNSNPPYPPPQARSRKYNREDFTSTDSRTIRSGMIYFIFFLIALSVVLCICMICMITAYRK